MSSSIISFCTIPTEESPNLSNMFLLEYDDDLDEGDLEDDDLDEGLLEDDDLGEGDLEDDDLDEDFLEDDDCILIFKNIFIKFKRLYTSW